MTSLPDPISILISVSLLGLVPFLAIMVTSYSKIVIVLGLLRNALGLQQIPPNLVINGLAIVVSIYIMAPVMNKIYTEVEPLIKNKTSNNSAIVLIDAVSRAKEPLRDFLYKHSNHLERDFFVKSSTKIWANSNLTEIDEKNLLVLLPAFSLTELTAAFKIGFIIYIGFVIVDLLVANVLAALGMMMFSPTIISIPLKLFLFVMLDGWSRLIHGLILTYS